MEHRVLNKCSGSREIHMGDVRCILASDDTGEMKKKVLWKVLHSVTGVRESSHKYWRAMGGWFLSIN